MGFIDIEDALQQALNEAGFNACAKPLPADFGMPHVTVDMLNAQHDNEAQALYAVDLDCRAETYAEAAQLQCEVAGWARSLEGRSLGGKPCYLADSVRLQRCQPDAAHQDAILATVSAVLRVRVAD